MDNNEDTIVDLPDMGIELPLSKIHSLLDMFSSPGWKVISQIWQNEKEAVIESGMSLSSTDDMRTMSRGVYHKLVDLQTIEGNIKHANDIVLGLAKPED